MSDKWRFQKWAAVHEQTAIGVGCICADELESALAQAERQRDEARGLLREAHSRIRYDDGEDDLLYVKIDAHLRDTGD